MHKKTKKIIAIGTEAKKMVGKTPSHIIATRPLVDGVISDFEVTEQMFRYFIEKARKKRFIFNMRPRVIVGVPVDGEVLVYYSRDDGESWEAD